MAFTDAPRNMAQYGLVVVNNSGDNAAANVSFAGVISAYELLETQGRGQVGEEVWTNDIAPLL